MKKITAATINNLLFEIDEEAYDYLKNYFSNLQTQFDQLNGRDEILEDIEARVSECLIERMGASRKVVSLQEVIEVIDQVGKPEDLNPQNKNSPQEKKEKLITPSKKIRRLFRNVDDKLIGGVCSGIATYFELDPVLIRLCFVILFFIGGGSLIAYIILWIVVPKRNHQFQIENITRFERSIDKENLTQEELSLKCRFLAMFNSTVGRSILVILLIICLSIIFKLIFK